jgi:hypothetical protein
MEEGVSFRIQPGKETSVPLEYEAWSAPEPVWTQLGRKKSFAVPDIEHRSSSPYPRIVLSYPDAKKYGSGVGLTQASGWIRCLLTNCQENARILRIQMQT